MCDGQGDAESPTRLHLTRSRCDEALLLVALDHLRGPLLGLVGVEPGGCARLSLVQQVVDAIELDLDLLEPVLLVLTQARAIAGRGVQALFLGGQGD